MAQIHDKNREDTEMRAPSVAFERCWTTWWVPTRKLSNEGSAKW